MNFRWRHKTLFNSSRWVAFTKKVINEEIKRNHVFFEFNDISIFFEDFSKCLMLHLQRLLYKTGRVTSQVRLLQGQTVLEDDRKLSEYSLPEGVTISTLFELDVDINIEVSTGQEMHKLTVLHTTSVMALKVKMCGIMRFGVGPERSEMRLGDVTLDDMMPLHFYGIKDGSKLEILKPYVNATIQNNQGATLYWRLERKDTIREVKSELAAFQSSSPMRFFFYTPWPDNSSLFSGCDEIRGFHGTGMIAKSMRLYLVTEEGELDDEKTVEDYKIKEMTTYSY